MKIHFYSPVAFEPWDWRNSVEQGIGGSETSHVEMAWRLARRGHEVITYAPIPEDCPGEWRGTAWHPLAAADFSEPGLWILYRCPTIVDEFLLRSPQTHPVWLLFQDWSYPDLTPARIARCSRLVTLCHWHGRELRRTYPTGADRIWITSNGLKGDLLAEVEASPDPPVRNPHKIMFASSPDRGLLPALRAVARAREFVPTLELHAFYGYNNLDKLLAGQPSQTPLAAAKAEVLTFADLPWVHLRGRVSQQTLYREWLSAGLWVYQTDFHETSCITCMEAQACGAIPIVSPVAALAENVHWGIGIEGAATDPLTSARFAAEIVRASDPAFQAAIRPQMMADARQRFDWENFVDQWEAAIREDLRDAPRPPLATPLALPDTTNVVVDALRAGLPWEPELTPYFAAAAGGLAIEVGAYLGEHTRLLAAHADQVWALEPQPAVVPFLEVNTAACGNVQVFPVAAYDQPTRLGIVDEHDWRSGTSPGACYAAGDEAPTTAIVLDPLWIQAGRPPVTLLKIDTEGCDAAVLRGASALLAACHPLVLCERGNPIQTARHGDTPTSAQHLLEALGYTCEILSDTNFVARYPTAPRLSVVTPSIRLSGLPVVWDCLRAQTYPHWEWLIAVPAALKDAAWDWVLTLDDPRVTVYEEPYTTTDFYQLNKAWNLLFLEAKGSAIISATDWLWFEPQALTRLVQHHLAAPLAVLSVPTSHVRSVDTLDDLTWIDYRLLLGQSCGDLPLLEPSAVELNLTLIPVAPLLAVGGMDESYDAVAGYSEKHLAYRLRRAGCPLLLAKRIQARAIEHPKEWANWDAKVMEGRLKLDRDTAQILHAPQAGVCR